LRVVNDLVNYIGRGLDERRLSIDKWRWDKESGRVRRLRPLLPALVGALLLVLPAWSTGGGPRTELTSVFTGVQPIQGTSSSFGRVLSASGRRALFSVDDDALPGMDGTRDIYLRDRRTDRTRLISKATSGEPANGGSGDDPSISANGRFVAFTSDATNLSGATLGAYLRDLKKGTTRLVSRTSGGDPTNTPVDGPVLSADGRYVAFGTDSDDLPGMDGTTDVYLRDRKQRRTTLISKATDGTLITDASGISSISANGKFVAFSSSSNLLPGGMDTNDVYVRDVRAKRTILVSKTSAEVPANGDSFVSVGALSADGSLVAFESSAANLGASGAEPSVFIRNRDRGKTRLASLTAGGDTAIGESAAISANGLYVAYESDDSDLPGGDTPIDVFRYDLRARRTILISRNTQGAAGLDDSFYASISAAGRIVAFTSRADNLSGEDDNDYSNTFVRVVP
jgi:Tol biopolymer transport system component